MAVVRCTSGSSLVMYDTIGVTVRKRPNSCVLFPNVAQLAIAAAKFFLNESSVVFTENVIDEIQMTFDIKCNIILPKSANL